MDALAILEEIGLTTLAFVIVVGPVLYILSSPGDKKKGLDHKKR